MFDYKALNSIIVLCVFIAVTGVAIELKNTNVLWWYLCPTVMYIFNVILCADEESRCDEEELRTL